MGRHKRLVWHLLVAMELWLELPCKSFLLLMLGLSSLLVVRLELDHVLQPMVLRQLLLVALP